MEYPKKPIAVGSTNKVAVMAIKSKLNEAIGAGLYDGNPLFGPATYEAVVSFQRSNRLIADGIVGELTWNRLFAVRDKSITNLGGSKIGLLAVSIAKTNLYVRELTGKNDGKEVEEFLALVGLPKSYSWCMAFVYAMFNDAAKQLKVGNPVPRTAGVLDCLKKAKGNVVKTPLAGDQFIMDFGGGLGHTGIISSVYNDRIFTVEGNTSADPSYKGEDRDGNGVFERNRLIKSASAFIRY